MASTNEKKRAVRFLNKDIMTPSISDNTGNLAEREAQAINFIQKNSNPSSCMMPIALEHASMDILSGVQRPALTGLEHTTNVF